jgi:hypothetical protein
MPSSFQISDLAITDDALAAIGATWIGSSFFDAR